MRIFSFDHLHQVLFSPWSRCQWVRGTRSLKERRCWGKRWWKMARRWFCQDGKLSKWYIRGRSAICFSECGVVVCVCIYYKYHMYHCIYIQIYIYIYSTIIHIYIDRYLFICNLQVAGNPSFCFFLGWIQVYLLAPKVQCRHHLHHQSNSNDKCLQQHSNKSCNCRRASSDEVSHKFSNEEILLLHSMMFIIIFDFQ